MQFPSCRRPRRAGVPVPGPAALATGVLLLCACVSPGLASRHRALEGDWRQSGGQAEGVEGDWRQSGGQAEGVEGDSRQSEGRGDAPTGPDVDAALAAAPVLSREALVRAVLERNPSLRAARYAWKAALERYPQEISLDDPMLGYGVAPASFGSSSVEDGYRVELSQRLPFPGKLSLRGEIALADAEGAAGDFEAVRLRLATMASLLFDELYLLERSREINDEHLELLDEFLRIATARYEAGDASQQDPLQAEVERAHLLHRDVVLHSEQRVAVAQLNALLHRPPEAGLSPPPQRLDPPAAADLDREALLGEALEARPELRAARARIAGRASEVALARREFLPDFNVVGAYDRIWQERDLQPFVGVQLNVPLQIARRRAALEEARASLTRAESEHAGLEDEVRFAVSSGVERLEEARHVVHLYESRLLPAAGDQVEAARAGFETGRNSFLALIEAERNLRGVRLGYEQALTDASRRRAELQSAVGRLPGAGGQP